MVHDSSSWTVISFIAEGQPEDISMMEILNTWLDAKVLHAKKNIYTNMEIALSYHIYRFCEACNKQLAVQEKHVSFQAYCF